MHSIHVHYINVYIIDNCIYLPKINASFTIVATIAFAASNALLILVCMSVLIPVEESMNSEFVSVCISIIKYLLRLKCCQEGQKSPQDQGPQWSAKRFSDIQI